MRDEVAALNPAKPLSANKDKVLIRDLNFYYGQTHALKGVNLNLIAGQVTAFIGPSGCGAGAGAAQAQPARADSGTPLCRRPRPRSGDPSRSTRRAGHPPRPDRVPAVRIPARKAGRVFSRAQLLDAFWGQAAEIDERTVDVHVGRLRKALSRGRERDPIRTVRGDGYAFDETFGKL